MKNKDYIDKLTKYYHKVPTKIYGLGLSSGAVALYCYLASNREDFNPSTRVVAKKLRVSRGNLIKRYKELIEKNIIMCYNKGTRTTTAKYMFVRMEEWIK